MPFGQITIPPLDTVPGTGIGVSIPFNAPSAFNTTYTTQDAIRNNIINYLLTNTSERYLNNDFGANLRRFIFEQISNDSLRSLRDNVQGLLRISFPNISVTSVNLSQDPDYNEVTINIRYFIINTNIEDQINITLA